MEVVIFCITLTAIMCVCLVAIGYIVGREVNDNVIDKNMDERADVSNNSELSDTHNRDRRGSGNSTSNQRMDKGREIIKYKDGKITNEYSKVVLETMLIMMKNILSETEKDAIEDAIKNTILIEKLNKYINDKNNIDIKDYI